MNDRIKHSIVDLMIKAREGGLALFLEGDKLRYSLQKGRTPDPLLISKLKEEKQAIIDFLKSESGDLQMTRKTLPKVKAYNREDFQRFPLSFSQERVWFIDKMQGSSHYHIPAALRFIGQLDIPALELAFRKVIERHEILRTVYQEEDGVAFQKVKKADQWTIGCRQIKDYPTEKELLQLIEGEINTPFALSKDYMLNATVLTLNQEESILILVVHHIAADGWSLSIILDEVVTCYQGFINQESADLPALDIQYADFAKWQREHLNGDILDQKLAYWTKKLAGLTPLNLPTDFARPAIQSTEGESLPFTVDKHLLSQLEALAQDRGVTLFMVLLAALKVVLFKYSGQSDICIGTPTANRPQQELEPLVGFFLNTLALRSDLSGNPQFSTLLSQLKQTTLEAFDKQEVPFERIVDHVEKGRDLSRSPIFQILFVLQNTPEPTNIEVKGGTLTPVSFDYTTAKFDLSFNLTPSEDGLIGDLVYSSALFTRETAEQIARHYSKALEYLAAYPETKINELDLLSNVEKQSLHSWSNSGKVTIPEDKTLAQLFEAQVARSPENTALVWQEQSVSYQELNELSNQLGQYLRSSYNIQADDRIGIKLDRSEWLIIAILGTLKSGAAYVPINPEYPQDRINYLIKNSDCKVLIDEDELNRFKAVQSQFNVENLVSKNHSSNLAYIIYTSGSTGNPKGCLVEHRSVVNYLLAQIQTFGITEEERILQLSNISFDTSVEQIFLALLSGAATCLTNPEIVLDHDAFATFVNSQAITHIHAVPSLLSALPNGPFPSLLRVVSGGESCPPALAEQWGQHCAFYNKYGPTEATITSSVYRYSEAPAMPYLPIGKPIANTQTYILDDNQNLVPVGVEGEIYIGGIGLARGYHGQPLLTDKKFVEHPFQSEQKLYKTGDRGKWTRDGNIVFLGRRDNQVKLRGYRIELGEIESILAKVPEVIQAVVAIKKDESEAQKLMAYVVCEKDFDKNSALKFLKSHLPEYMVPQVIIELDQLPTTPNGKIDRNALPNPDLSTLLADQFVAPSTEEEIILAKIWQKLLQVEKVGIYDNFFELGGDSITTIQVVSRAKQQGIHIAPRDIFQNQCIADLVAAIRDNQQQIEAEQGLLSGSAGLSPIQKAFFERLPEGTSHYNQSILLNIAKGITAEVLSKAIDTIAAQHDALRFLYKKEGGEWNQLYREEWGNLLIEDLSEREMNSSGQTISDICNNYQKSLDIQSGDLFRAVLIKTPEAEPYNRFFLVIHHLAIDGVSWRIICEQLEQILLSTSKDTPINLGPKSSSYRQWVKKLEAHATSQSIEHQLPFWANIHSKYQPLPTDSASDQVFEKDTAEYSFTLDQQFTTKLLQNVNHAYHTEINDILLAALSKTICDWSGHDSLTIGLEGHGREDLFSDIDLSTTVGWFTNLYPVALASGKSLSEGQLVKKIKEQLRAIPNKGMGYGLLRYLHPSENFRRELLGNPWDIVFNYLGQFDNVASTNPLITGAEESVGDNVGEDYPFGCKILIISTISGGKLEINWKYSTKQYQQKTIEELGNQYLEQLQKIILHCQSRTWSEKTPFDYGLAPMVQFSELERFLYASENGGVRKDNIESVSRLSPMQEGMLFHGLYEGQSKAYTEQLCFDFPEGVDIQAFEESWNHLLVHHTILRSAFFHEELSIPVQCVYKDVKVPLNHQDLSHLEGEKLDNKIANLLSADLEKGFDFTQAPLLRITLIKTGQIAWKMVFTHHHILLDGWSLPVLIGELLQVYEAKIKKLPLPSLPLDLYEDYIRFIHQKDAFAEEAFWKNYLQNIESASLLPLVSPTVERNRGGITSQEIALTYNQKTTKAIKYFVQKHHLTVNTLIQGVWAYLLSRYTNTPHTVFGVTVSGRPAELSEMEQRVGLYINTIPVATKVQNDQVITEWLTELQNGHTSARAFQYTPLNKTQQWAGIQGDLFDSILVFENYPLGEVIKDDWSLAIDNIQTEEQTNYLLTITAGLGEALELKFKYNNELLACEQIEKLKQQFDHVLQQIIEGQHDTIAELEAITAEEKEEILNVFNQTVAHYDQQSTIIDLLQKQVQRTPEKAALCFNGQTITYRELDERSNQIANHLRKEGVKHQERVGILSYRGFEMIISIFGVLKCGATYVPLNTDYPAERMDFMLSDANARILICGQPELSQACTLEGYRIVDYKATQSSSVEPPDLTGHLSDIAYIMYTSGTTGTPKGILVTQQNILKLVHEPGPIAIGSEDRVLQWSNFAFDGSTYDIHNSLLNGATLYLIGEDEVSDPAKLAKYLREDKITTAFLTTALFNGFVEYDVNAFKGIRKVLFGGEKVSVPHVRKALEVLGDNKIIHVYGPTETTVYATYLPVNDIETDLVPIGRPLTNTQVYIVDQSDKLSAVGMPGEVWIGGDGVSNGYLNRPELTADKFTVNPFAKNEHSQLYKTGDIAKWLPDGTIEFIGRKDNQVKLRGYRIELGEIENALNAAPNINQGVVLVRKDQFGNKRLMAYVTTEEPYDYEMLQKHLLKQLPEYMVPTTIMELAEFPLTTNGKVDKKALPMPDVSALSNAEFIAPRNDVEANLALIWKELLNLDQIGIHDNFFEMGGDSIITIQVVSRAKRVGYQLSPRDLFENPTIAQLSEVVDQQKQAITAEQGPLTGNAPLLPIQQWYFEQPTSNPSFFNQGVLLEADKLITEDTLATVLEALMLQHDALRFAYTRNANDWSQTYHTTVATPTIEDLTDVKENELEAKISSICTKVQESLDLELGQLLKIILIKTPEFASHNRIFFVIHHLVVDGISWRILLEQLELALDQLSNGQVINLGPKTSSYRAWGDALIALASKNKIESQLDYWKATASTYAPVPVDFEHGTFKMKDFQSCSVELSEELTTALLQESSLAYHTQIDDILLSALVKTIQQWANTEKIVIGLESHGREDLFPSIDLSSTVGWFTNLYPVALEAKEGQSAGELIKCTKELMRTIPDKGIGFGLLKYLHPSTAVQKQLSESRWDIVFNYLGQFDNVMQADDGLLQAAGESIGQSIDPEFPFQAKLLVNSMVSEGVLSLTWAYSPRQYKKSTIEQLTQQYLSNLSQLILHCKEQQQREFTPSDFGLNGKVSASELSEFLQSGEPEGDEILTF